MHLKWISVLLLFPTISVAQVTFNNPDEGGVVSYLTRNADYSDIKADGSPYLNEEFVKGEVYVYDSLGIRGELRYNAFNSEVEVSETKGSYFTLLKRPYIEAEIGDRLFKMYTYKDNNDLNRVAYFNPLNEGNIVLLFKPEIKLKKAKAPETGYDKYVAPKYIDISSYYIKLGEEPAREIKLKKKTFNNLLKNKKEAVVSFIKDKDLNLSSEEDVILILNYYNELQ